MPIDATQAALIGAGIEAAATTVGRRRFIETGPHRQLLAHYGLTSRELAARIQAAWGRHAPLSRWLSAVRRHDLPP
ncbi:MAG: hypothetical protein ACRDUV_26970 [Pseudonocardiaceae bacterium]